MARLLPFALACAGLALGLAPLPRSAAPIERAPAAPDAFAPAFTRSMRSARKGRRVLEVPPARTRTKRQNDPRACVNRERERARRLRQHARDAARAMVR